MCSMQSYAKKAQCTKKNGVRHKEESVYVKKNNVITNGFDCVQVKIND